MDTLAFPLDFKSIDAAGAIEGVAAGVGNVDRGGDRIMPSAFAKSLAQRGGSPIPMLRDHDTRRAIGAWTDVRETEAGLLVKGQIVTATRDGAEAHALAAAGALRGLSIGYFPMKAAPRGSGRDLIEIDLAEVSLVAVPMNERGAVTSIKAINGASDIRDLLQAAGLSGRQAKAAAGAAWRSINEQSDEDGADAELAALLAASAKRLGF